MSVAPLTTDVVVGRQGIYAHDGALVGYELLFRGLSGGRSGRATGDQMTAEVVFGAHAIGLDQLASGRLIFCNADRGVLAGDIPLTLPPEQTVVEVLETVTLDPEALAGCRSLVAEGYRLAADDFVWRPGAEQLLTIASIVKIDVLQVSGAALRDLVGRCQEYDVQLLAEKVEDRDQLAMLAGMGFELFQGYALERPRIVSTATIEASQLSRLRHSAVLLTDQLQFEEIERILRADPGLAVQVMQLASVGRIGEPRRRVNDLHDALVLAGSRRVQNWIALLLARPSGGITDRDRFATTLIRARACELLAGWLDAGLAGTGFAAGMLSAIDVMFDVAPESVRLTLSLSDDLWDAAFGGTSPLGRVVRDAVDFQLGRPDPQRLSGLSEQELSEAFSTAFTWAMASTAALEAAPPD